MKTKIEVSPDVENRDNYFVQGVKGELSALAYLEIEYPELKGKFKAKHAREVYLAKCLDCETYWIDDEGLCGDCGESRLSKVRKQAWYFNINLLSQRE